MKRDLRLNKSATDRTIASYGINYKLNLDFVQMVICKRLEKVHSSGKDPLFEHPEISEMSVKEVEQLGMERGEQMISSPPTIIRAVISAESLKKLKADVYSTRVPSGNDGGVEPSSNDCMTSVLYRALLECLEVDTDTNPREIFPYQLAINVRFRRNPPTPKTFFGNCVLTIWMPQSRKDVLAETVFETASNVRKNVMKTNEAFIQSSIDKISQCENAQFTSFWDSDTFCFTNWNTYFDWYGHADLGKGEPAKFTLLLKMMVRFFVILPGKEPGSIELVIGHTQQLCDKFQRHPDFVKYFELR